MVSQAHARLFDPNYSREESEYGWLINRDHLEGGFADILGPHNITQVQVDVLRHPRINADKVTRFRIYDDDGELYYSGYFLGDSEGEYAFAPLDDFGAPDSGATEIRYLRVRDGAEVWETL